MAALYRCMGGATNDPGYVKGQVKMTTSTLPVNLGFKPKFLSVLAKNDANGKVVGMYAYDSERGSTNIVYATASTSVTDNSTSLSANGALAEVNNTGFVMNKILSTQDMTAYYVAIKP